MGRQPALAAYGADHSTVIVVLSVTLTRGCGIWYGAEWTRGPAKSTIEGVLQPRRFLAETYALMSEQTSNPHSERNFSIVNSHFPAFSSSQTILFSPTYTL